MKKKTLIFLLFLSVMFCLSKSYLYARDGFSYIFESRIYKNIISGSTEQAVLKDGFFNEENFIVEYNRSRETSPVEIKSAVNLRLTNDRQTSGKDFELRNYYFMLTAGGGNFGLSLGNVYNQFSKYVLNRNVEGISGYLKFGKTVIAPVYGQTQKAENDRAYQRIAYGFRVENSPTSKTKIGLNYLTTADNPNSVSLDTTTFRREEGNIISIDGSAFIGAFRFEGEVASSGYDEKNTARSEKGLAYRIKSMYRKNDFRTEVEYEVADSSFNSLSGWAIKDRSILKARIGYTFSENWAADLSYEIMKNNVSGYLPFGESATSPALMINFALPKSKLDTYLSGRIRDVVSSDSPRTSDRGTTTLGCGAAFRLGKYLRPSLSIENNFNVDRKTPTNDTRNTFYETTVKALFDKISERDLSIIPSVSYRLSEDYASITGITDFSKTVLLRLSAESGKYWELSGNHTITWTDRNNTLSSASRHLWLIDITGKIKGSSDRTITLGYSTSDNEARTPTETTKYTESVIEARLRLRL